MLEERQPGPGGETQRQADGKGRGRGGGAAPGGSGSPPSETAAEILSSGGSNGKRRSASRVGITAVVIIGVAVAAGIAGLVLLTNSSGGRQAAAARAADAPPLRVESVSPGPKSSHVSGDIDVLIAFSSKLAPSSVVPTFHPAVPGQWQANGTMLSFTPDAPFAPSTRYTLTIPGGRSGLRSAAGGVVARQVVYRFTTGAYSKIRLGQVLSQLGYLPLTWQPTGSDRMTGGTSAGGLSEQEQLAYSPPPGSYAWDNGYPASLRAAWAPDKPNSVLRGAVMAFQAQHHMAINGAITKRFWGKLLGAAASTDRNSLGYTYAIANKGSPETLTIWHNGHVVLRSLANTGGGGVPTVSGTFPVYQRYRFQIMQGTNPGGGHYADPVSFVAYFNGGDAVHYYPRGSYGFPQSLGCVELPYNDARKAWPFLTYGSLVTVTG